VNCAALPTGLIERALRPREGAFTGAFEKRIGRFAAGRRRRSSRRDRRAAADVQVKLLRVLQEREAERLGGSATIRSTC
jgi:transcriptional regulator with GAF, ATPase, and Fis domain